MRIFGSGSAALDIRLLFPYTGTEESVNPFFVKVF